MSIKKGGASPSRVSVLIAILLMISLVPVFISDVAEAETYVLKVATLSDTRTSNYFDHKLNWDRWTAMSVEPVLDGLLKLDSWRGNILPYVAKGVDANENGVFEAGEYGTFQKEGGTDLRNFTVFYDLDGVSFHDGQQVSMNDVLFSYHVEALMPDTSSMDVVKDLSGEAGSNYTDDRWLWINPIGGFNPSTEWMGHKDGPDDSLRFALFFGLQNDRWNFQKATLDTILLPASIWQGTGTASCPHPDFGYAVDSATKNGVPKDHPSLSPFNLSNVATWNVPDVCVVATGPFTWTSWTPNVSVEISRNVNYHTTVNATGHSYTHAPFFDTIEFYPYSSEDSAISALKNGDVDLVPWPIPPSYVPELEAHPNIEVNVGSLRGFSYLGYDMRVSGAPWSYASGDPSQGDAGKPFRTAMSHLIDRANVVEEGLSGFGAVADGVVSPEDTLYYNTSLPDRPFDPSKGTTILENAGYHDVDLDGWREFGSWNSDPIEILCPDYNEDMLLAEICERVTIEGRGIGINLVANYTQEEILRDRVASHDVHIWIFRETTRGEALTHAEPPDYIDALFASEFYPEGRNLAGYANDSFDGIDKQVLQELNLSKVASLVRYEQGILSEDLPYDSIFYSNNIEAYRSDRTTNWTEGPLGCLFLSSYWSWVGVEPPIPQQLEVDLSITPTMYGGDQKPVTVTVMDPDVQPYEGLVNMTASDGHFWETGAPHVEALAIGGSLTVIFVAPSITSLTEIYINATASDPLGFYADSTTQTALVSVHPKPVHLVVMASIGSDVVLEGSSVHFNITVTDEDANPVVGAWVNMTSDPATGSLTPDSGTTNQTGFLGPVLFESPQIAEAQVVFVITVSAERTGYESNGTQLTIRVIDDDIAPTISHQAVSSAFVGEAIGIEANVTDDAGMSAVVLYYLPSDSDDWVVISMTPFNTSGYEATIPAQPREGTLLYYIMAHDASGNNASHPTEGRTAPHEVSILLDTDGDSTPDIEDDDDDNDGMPDEWEVEHDLDPSDEGDSSLDPDEDGLTNLEEYEAGTDPNEEDTDEDGVKDGEDEDPLSPEEEESFIGWILLVLAIIVLVLVLVIIILRRRRKQEDSSEDT